MIGCYTPSNKGLRQPNDGRTKKWSCCSTPSNMGLLQLTIEQENRKIGCYTSSNKGLLQPYVGIPRIFLGCSTPSNKGLLQQVFYLQSIYELFYLFKYGASTT